MVDSGPMVTNWSRRCQNKSRPNLIQEGLQRIGERLRFDRLTWSDAIQFVEFRRVQFRAPLRRIVSMLSTAEEGWVCKPTLEDFHC